MRAQPGDTIAAISTALGPGAVALVRLSGEGALEVADAVFRGTDRLSGSHSHTVHYGHVVDTDGRPIDEVLATVLLAPHTYTTEHMIEFGCHGGSVAARAVLAACLEAGARPARRGEFTERAFIHGRLDLVQAEAVADIVGAETPTGLRLALGQLEGGLSGRLKQLRETLVELRAELEAAIDLVDDMDGAFRPDVSGLCESAAEQVSGLLANCEFGVAVRDGVVAAIVGRPNVGKSSLMNALLMRDRSIVTAIPGTTRDALEELLHLDGVPVRLIDTAGIRRPADAAESAGVERAQAAASGATLTILVLDASEPLGDDDLRAAERLAFPRTVVALNKADLEPATTAESATAFFSQAGLGAAAECVSVSAMTGEGLPQLREAIGRAGIASPGGGDVDVTNVRHVEALRQVMASIEVTLRLSEEGAPYEVVAAELAAATDALGEISGETTPEDVIERIFERFCVGK
jgi:tRNA modification GTPase